MAMWLAKEQGLIATLPTKATELYADNDKVKVLEPPFDIPPIALKMAWSPLLHHDVGHIWLRRLIVDVGSK
jgi:hypothetical protein